MSSISLLVFGLFLLLCNQMVLGFDDDDSDENFPPEYLTKDQDPETIRLKASNNATLNCKAAFCHSDKTKVSWEYKACKPDKFIPCEKQHGSWKKLDLKHTTYSKRKVNLGHNKCYHQLKILKANETDSGVYRCIENGIKIKSFKLEVIDAAKYNKKRPEILDISPSNITTYQHLQVVIQCKVYSELRPAIVWFKETEEISNDTLYYHGKSYKMISTLSEAHPLPNETDVYLNKLNIQNTSSTDSGVYVCVALTPTGQDNKTAAVLIERTFEEIEEGTSFSILFFIPLPFVLIPIIAWLCYYRKKIRWKRPVQQQAPLIRPAFHINKRISHEVV